MRRQTKIASFTDFRAPNAPNTISLDKFLRLVGATDALSIIDVRSGEDFAIDPLSIPGAVRRAPADIALWSPAYAGRLAAIVRGADTGRPDLVPEAAGLLAVSLGLSRLFADDLEQRDAGTLVYDALYRWCRDATGETHDWVSH